MMMTMPVTSAPVSSPGRVALAKEKFSISQGFGASSSSASSTNLQLVRGAGSILFNNSMMEEQPQGDQPGPPFNTEGLPNIPPNWKQSTQRELYLHNREGLFLAMLPDGRTQGVQNASESAFSVFVLLSHMSNLVMKGFVSEKFLCRNTTSSELYARADVHSDCYMNETLRNNMYVFVFNNCHVTRRRRCYLGLSKQEKSRGKLMQEDKVEAHWYKVDVTETSLQEAKQKRKEIEKNGPWKQPVDEKEQTRKRVRRWCRNLSLMVNNKKKYLDRCKKDCERLKEMINNPEKSMRKCLYNIVRRREMDKVGKNRKNLHRIKTKIRKGVAKLWPEREAIFRRLRQLRRCNRKREKKNLPRCTKKEVKRNERKRKRIRNMKKQGDESVSTLPPATVATFHHAGQTTTTAHPQFRNHSRQKRDSMRSSTNSEPHLHRTRRWCRVLSLIVQNPSEYLKRCRKDCDRLTHTTNHSDRYVRKYLYTLVRRRMAITLKDPERNNSFLDKMTVRKDLQSVWPNRVAMFRKFRLLWRCNSALEKQGLVKRGTNKDTKRLHLDWKRTRNTMKVQGTRVESVPPETWTSSSHVQTITSTHAPVRQHNQERQLSEHLKRDGLENSESQIQHSRKFLRALTFR